MTELISIYISECFTGSKRWILAVDLGGFKQCSVQEKGSKGGILPTLLQGITFTSFIFSSH